MDKPIKKIINVEEGVAHKARPFNIKAKSDNDTLIIIIHGFTSSPYRMHFISDFLASHGFDIETILLAGHGGGLERLRNSTSDDWYRSAEKVLVGNLDKYKNIYLMGYSFGANIAIHLAVNYPKIKGIVSLGIPIYLKLEKPIRLLLPLARIFKNKYRKRWIHKKDYPKLAERGHHAFIPIKGLIEFYKFIDTYTKKEMDNLKIPMLVIHSRGDLVANPISSEILFRNLTTRDKSLFILNKGDHQLENGTRKDYIANKILGFISK